MEIDYISHHLLFFTSLAAGVVSGAVYDAVKLSRAFFRGRVFLFVTDLLFCLYHSCIMCVLFFNYSYGRIRAYALLASALGFAAYYFTLGRVTKSVFAVIKAVMRRFLKKVSSGLSRRCGRLYRRAYSYFSMRSALISSSKGFGITKKIKRSLSR